MDADIIIKKIIENTGKCFEEVNRTILNKQQELSNLVSKDGAAYIVAKEMGLDLFEKTQRRLEIKNVVSGIKNLNLNARIFRIFPPKEFEYKGKKCKVANVILSDESGTIRMSLWDTQLDLLEKNKLKVGQAVEIFGAYTRDNSGIPEIRLSRRGGINILENSDIPFGTKEEMVRTDICNIQEGKKYEVRAALVQIFNTGLIYEMCPTCKKRVKKEGSEFVCETDGKVKPEYLIVLNGVIDDGTGNVRTVLFRDDAVKVLGVDLEKIIEIGPSLLSEVKTLGKEFIFEGSLKKNKMFNKSEFVISGIKDVNVKEEANTIINSLSKK